VLGFDLIPWQRWLLIHALELRPDGRFRFRTVLVLVARQNGKTTIVEVKNLWKMFVLRVPLVIGTAQNLDVSEESWDKAVEIVESIPELAAEVPKEGGVVRVNGKKSLKLVHGSRWKVAAASRKGGRGLSGDDVNLDELREHHTWDSWAAVTKTTMARRKAQIWAFSNAGDDRSVVLNDLQDKGRETLSDPDSDSTLGIFEWSAPDDCPIDDPQMWRLANPSLGYPQGISVEALRAALETDPEPIFRTECLCQRVPDLVPSKIPLTAWVKCADPKSAITGGVVLSWQVSWDRSWGSIGVCGYRGDG
jgi:phage terminase large subunit-like protein